MRSAECAVLGNFTDEVTLLGVAGQITLGILDLDLPCDIRDIIADVRNLAQADEIKWDMIAMLALDLIGVIPVIGALKYSDEIGTLFKNADKVSVVARSTDGAGVLAKHADEAGAWLHGVKVFRYSDETAEAVASGEKLLKESGTVYESFADMMSPEDAKRYLDFLENGSREGLTGAELAGVEKADALLVSRKVGYEDVWDLRNAGDLLESGLDSVDDIFTAGKKTFDNFDINNAYVKPKHLSTTGGNGQKFIGASKAETESILKDALSNGKIVSISDNGLTKVGNASYEIVIDAGKIVGTKGENLVKIVISSDGGMLSAYPIK